MINPFCFVFPKGWGANIGQLPEKSSISRKILGKKSEIYRTMFTGIIESLGTVESIARYRHKPGILDQIPLYRANSGPIRAFPITGPV